MLYSLSLNQSQISCEKICAEIQNIISKYNNQNSTISDCVLVIDIRKVTDSLEESGPLKLEHKNI